MISIQDVPALKTGGGAVPVCIAAPNLTRTPPSANPPKIPIINIDDEYGGIAVGTGVGNNGAVEPARGVAFEVQSKIGVFSPPRMTNAERNAIAIGSAERGLIFNTTTNTIDVFNGTSWIQYASVEATTTNTPNTIVKRDADKKIYVSGVETTGELTISSTGNLNMNSGNDVISAAAGDYSFTAQDNFLIQAGAPNYVHVIVGAVTMIDVKQNQIGFFGVAAVSQPGAYTISFAGAASRTLPAAVSSYTGIADGEAGTPYASISDLNALATQVNNLTAVVKSLLADVKSLGLVA